MIKAQIGISNHLDSFSAGAEACKKSLAGGEQETKLLIVFSTISYDQEALIKGIKSVAEDIPLVGCSDAGEIVTAGPLSKHVAVLAINTDSIEFTIGVGTKTDQDSFFSGKEAAQAIKAKAKTSPSLFMMFLDGLAENGAAAVRGVQDIFGKKFPIIGGSAGDDFLFKKTYEYHDDQVLTNSIVGIGFSGKFSFGVGVRHGWEPIGLPMEVTKSEGGKLIEVDGRPAISIYEDYFGKQTEELIKEPIAKIAYTYPLGMSVPGSSELLIRDVVLANKKGEINCAAEIPQGSKIRLMLGDYEKAMKAAREAAQNALDQLNGAKPKLIFVFNCIARHKLLGNRIKDEILAVQEILGKDVPLFGFYTYGEQAPLNEGGKNFCHSVFHNETIALLALGD